MSIHKIMAGLVAAAMAAGAFGTSPASAQADCNWYARQALKQQQTNERGKCGLSGDAWSSSFDHHLAWCGSVSPDDWKSAVRQREQELSSCGKKG